VAEPHADRVEDEAENTRKALQPDFTIGANTFRLQQFAYPGQWVRAVTGTVIREAEAEQIPAVDREQRALACSTLESGSRQK
jgi:hypothetical protein